jgi:DNA-binding CsgD family transcriptional regulator
MTFDASDPAAVASYAARTRRSVPGLGVLHRIVEQILAESVPDGGRVLVVGAGGGLELTYLAERHAGWTFDGVDPSAEMLALARVTMGPLSPRELDVLRLVALGHTNQEIAKELLISTRTTAMHRASIMRKLRFDTRAQLVNYALANGLIGAA